MCNMKSWNYDITLTTGTLPSSFINFNAYYYKLNFLKKNLVGVFTKSSLNIRNFSTVGVFTKSLNSSLNDWLNI